MSTSIPNPPAESLLLLQATLAELLQLLVPGQSDRDDMRQLERALGQALHHAMGAQLHGTTQLLRVAGAAVSRRAQAQVVYADTEKQTLFAWFLSLLAYCRGESDPVSQEELLHAFGSLPGLAALPPRLFGFLNDCLEDARDHVQLLCAAATASSWNDAGTARIDVNSEVIGEQQRVDHAAFEAPSSRDGAPIAQPEYAVAFDHSVDCAAHCPAPEGAMAFEAAPNLGALPAVAAAAPLAPIWIRPEELQLAGEAVASQILPGVFAIADAGAEDDMAKLVADLEFNIGLIGNAMDVLGTPALSRGILAVQSRVAAGEAAEPEGLLNWSAALVAYLEQPSAETSAMFASSTQDLSCLGDDWIAEFQSESQRVQIGRDPAAIANRKAVATAEDVALDLAADVLPNVLEGMLRELPGNAERLGEAIRRVVASGDVLPVDEARRVAHTLKGDANTVGVAALANLTHSLEDILIELHRQPELLQPELALVLERAADCVEEIADFLLGRGTAPNHLREVYQSLLDWSNAISDGTAPESLQVERRARVPEASQSTDSVVAASAAIEPDSAPVTPNSRPLHADAAPVVAAEAATHRTATLSVPATLLDELQRLSGETLVMARQIDQRLDVLASLQRDEEAEIRNSSILIEKLDDLISLRGAALQSTALQGGQGVDPLELDQYNELHVISRRLMESNADHNEHQRRARQLAVELDELRSQQEAVNADLQRMVQRVRMVPFEHIAGRLHRIVRQTARQLAREVALRIDGESTLLDAELLDRVVEPIAHLLRNAIDHGIEDADERKAAGKTESPSIDVSVRHVADSIEIQVRDNGRGLDLAAIHERAVARGLLVPGVAPSEAELARIILAPGFTTRQAATQVSGRGIGMDVVSSRVTDLRGQLNIATQRGKGLAVTMRFPASQTMANVIIALGHDLIVAAVAGSVERVVSLAPQELSDQIDGRVHAQIDGEWLPVIPIESMYGCDNAGTGAPVSNPLGLLVRSDRGRRVLISVSGIGAVSNVIVKPISAYLPPVPSVRGMTQLGDGRLASVVDMGALVDALDSRSDHWRATDTRAAPVRLPRAVVADDSLSVRRALSQLMEDAGFEVVAARDGLEALELINAESPSLVLLDLEMPKLNGLEVTRFMRGRAPTQRVPVLMITSRASDKYRTQALEAGVTMMLGKPYSEDDLMLIVRELMAESARDREVEDSLHESH